MLPENIEFEGISSPIKSMEEFINIDAPDGVVVAKEKPTLLIPSLNLPGILHDTAARIITR